MTIQRECQFIDCITALRDGGLLLDCKSMWNFSIHNLVEWCISEMKIMNGNLSVLDKFTCVNVS